MALGKQQASSHTLDRFLAWADAYGFRIGEHPDYGGVAPVHTRGSWHYDGLAADLNWGPPGTSRAERERFLYAIDVAQSMGLGCIYARDGRGGSAASHTTHLHVDCGPSTNFGAGYTRTPDGDRIVQQIQREVHFAMRNRDNLLGPNSTKRVEAVRFASRYHGVKFPYGKKLAQRAVGVTRDGVWGAGSRAGHDETVGGIQYELGVTVDHVWGPVTDAAWIDLLEEKKR